jgi:hypothetical protein
MQDPRGKQIPFFLVAVFEQFEAVETHWKRKWRPTILVRYG